MNQITCENDIERGLAELFAADPRLIAVHDVAKVAPLRLRKGDFEGLASIIVSQQISKSAAESIWSRVIACVNPLTAPAITATEDADLQACGLSRPKIRTFRAIAEACENGLDLTGLHTLPPDEAFTAMTAIKGIGPWTAEVYLLFCCGHGDIFPAGDIALQNAVQDAFDLKNRPGDKELRKIAALWSPWRGIAARLFWAYYTACRNGREVIPV